MISPDLGRNWTLIRARKVHFSNYHGSLAAGEFDVLAANRELSDEALERLHDADGSMGISIKTEDWAWSSEDEDEIIKKILNSKNAVWLEEKWNQGK